MLDVGGLEYGFTFVLLVDRVFFAHGHGCEQFTVRCIDQRDIRAGLDAGGDIFGSGQGNGDRPEESGSRFKVAAHAFPVGVRHEAVERGKAADAQHDQIAAFARTHRHFRQRARPSLFGGQRGAFQQQGFEACATMRRNQFGQGELLLFKSGRNGIVVIFGAQGSTRDRSDLSIYFIDE